jgi:hypothetical protein
VNQAAPQLCQVTPKRIILKLRPYDVIYACALVPSYGDFRITKSIVRNHIPQPQKCKSARKHSVSAVLNFPKKKKKKFERLEMLTDYLGRSL